MRCILVLIVCLGFLGGCAPKPKTKLTSEQKRIMIIAHLVLVVDMAEKVKRAKADKIEQELIREKNDE